MDPNAGKKNMFNKLSKQQCIELLNKEDFKKKQFHFIDTLI